MPTLLSPYVSRAQQRGAPGVQTGSAPQTMDLRPIASTAMDIAQVHEQLRAVQEREQEQLKANEARMMVSNTISRGQADWSEKLQKAQTSAPSGAAGFTDSTMKEFDTWTNEQLSGEMTPQARQLLTVQLQQMRLGIHAEAFKYEVTSRNKALVQDFSTGLDADRRAVMADPSRFMDTTARRVAAADTLNLPAESRAEIARKAREALAFDAANGLVDQSPAAFLERAGMRSAKGAKGKPGERETDAASRVAADPLLSSMDPAQLRQVTDRASLLVAQQEAAAAAEADRRARLAEIAAAKKEREAGQAMTILANRAMLGIATDPVGDPELFKAIEGTKYAKEYLRMAAEIPKRQATAMLPLSVQQDQIDQLIQRRNTGGTNTALEAEIKFRKDVIGAAQKAYEESPLRATQQYGLQNVAQIDTSSMPALLATIGPRVAQADVASTITKKSESPLYPEEAEQVGKMISVLPVEQRSSAVAQLAQAIGPDKASALGHQLAPRDKALGLAFALSSAKTTEGRYTSELLLRGGQALKDKTVAPDATKDSGWRKEIAGLIGNAYPNEELRQSAIEAAYLVRAGLEAEGKGSNEQAVKLATGGIVERQGRKLPLPYGVTANEFDKRLREVTPETLAGQAPDGMVYVGKTAMPLADFVQAVPDAQLIHAGQGRYAVSAGGGLVLNAKRAPIIIEVR